MDIDYRLHELAFLCVQAGAKKSVGKGKTKLVFSRFDKFYDYEAETRQVLDKDKKKDKFARIKEMMKKGGNHG